MFRTSQESRGLWNSTSKKNFATIIKQLSLVLAVLGFDLRSKQYRCVFKKGVPAGAPFSY
jgi:hypothetical protein